MLMFVQRLLVAVQELLRRKWGARSIEQQLLRQAIRVMKKRRCAAEETTVTTVTTDDSVRPCGVRWCEIWDDAFFEYGRNGTVERAPIAPGFFGQHPSEAPHRLKRHPSIASSHASHASPQRLFGLSKRLWRLEELQSTPHHATPCQASPCLLSLAIPQAACRSNVLDMKQLVYRTESLAGALTSWVAGWAKLKPENVVLVWDGEADLGAKMSQVTCQTPRFRIS